MDDSAGSRHLTLALLAWSGALEKGLRAKGGPDGFASLELHSRAEANGSEANVTLHAALVDDRPVIRVSLTPDTNVAERNTKTRRSSSTAAIFRGTGLSPREPDATCEGCGALGTVGRAVRTDEQGDALESHRFCLSCWPEQSARYRVRWEEEDRLRSESAVRRRVASGRNRGMTFEAATWHHTLHLVREVEREMRSLAPPARSVLVGVADAIAASASQHDGPIPLEVEGFVRRYGSLAAQPGA